MYVCDKISQFMLTRRYMAQRINNWTSILMIALILTLAISCVTLAASSGAANPSALSCGVESLLALKELLGPSPATDQISGLRDQFGSRSMSMLEIQQLGHELGIELVGQHVSLEALKKRGSPFIAHLKIGHFLAVDSVTPAYVRMLRLRDWPVLLPTADFAKEFSGYVLSVKENIAPGLSADGIHDFGSHVDAGALSAEFHLQNRSKTVVKLIDIAAECACTAVAPRSLIIDPGCHSTISLYYLAGAEPVFQKHIRIVTDDPVRSTYYLSICGAGGPYVRSVPESRAR